MTSPDIGLDEAWQLLRDDPEAILIDVRTTAEWQFVGVPVLDDLGKTVRFVEWTTFPDGARNPDFVDRAAADLDPRQPVLLLCRSGVRSRAAADALREAGFERTLNVAAGFEGDVGDDGHRHGGWKEHLPWRQR